MFNCCVFLFTLPFISDGGEFDESLDVVHKLVNVNCDNSFRDAEEDAVAQAKDFAGECAPFAINSNNSLLWEVRHVFQHIQHIVFTSVHSYWHVAFLSVFSHIILPPLFYYVY